MSRWKKIYGLSLMARFSIFRKAFLCAGTDPGHCGLSLQPLHGLQPGPPPLPRMSCSCVLQRGLQDCSTGELPQARILIKDIGTVSGTDHLSNFLASTNQDSCGPALFAVTCQILYAKYLTLISFILEQKKRQFR